MSENPINEKKQRALRNTTLAVAILFSLSIASAAIVSKCSEGKNDGTIGVFRSTSVKELSDEAAPLASLPDQTQKAIPTPPSISDSEPQNSDVSENNDNSENRN